MQDWWFLLSRYAKFLKIDHLYNLHTQWMGQFNLPKMLLLFCLNLPSFFRFGVLSLKRNLCTLVKSTPPKNNQEIKWPSVGLRVRGWVRVRFSNFNPVAFPEPSLFLLVLGRESSTVVHEMRWLCEPIRMHASLRLHMYVINNNFSMSPSWIWSDKTTNERVVRVGYNHFISNKGEWNNCFSKFSNRVLSPIFISPL